MSKFGVTEKKELELLTRMEACGVEEEDLEERFVRGGGPGGQKVNKTSSCVHLRHKPTELEVKSQQSRSQGLNRYYARKRLCELIEEQQAKEAGEKTKEQWKAEQIRKQKKRRRRKTKKKELPPPSTDPRDW